MNIKSLIAFTTSLTVVTAMLPLDLAYAGGYGNGGQRSYGNSSSGQAGCRNGGSQNGNHTSVYKPVNVTNNNVDNSKNTTVYHPVHVTNNVDNSKNTTVNKYTDNSKNTNVTNNYTKNIDNSKNTNITKNIDNSKNTTINHNITINKNIDNSKYIDNSKNTTYVDNSKNTGVSKSSSSADAVAIAAAVAAAVAASNSSSSATVNNYNNGNTTPGGGNNIIGVNAAAAASAASASNGGGGGAYISDQAMYQGGNFAVAVDTSAPVQSQQCVFQEATVVKAIHAECISADGNHFPASHMVGATWLDASYEGEVMRCIPGSHLHITVGEVVQSDQGMASTFTNGKTLDCAEHEALRHFKDGMLKCAIAVPVPDCTERTNLRRWGTGDMFFSYRTRVCAQTHREYSEIAQQQESSYSESSSRSSSSDMTLKGMQLDGGIGGSN